MACRSETGASLSAWQKIVAVEDDFQIRVGFKHQFEREIESLNGRGVVSMEQHNASIAEERDVIGKGVSAIPVGFVRVVGPNTGLAINRRIRQFRERRIKRFEINRGNVTLEKAHTILEHAFDYPVAIGPRLLNTFIEGIGHRKTRSGQRKLFTPPLFSPKPSSVVATQQPTKKKPRCQRGRVRGVAKPKHITEAVKHGKPYDSSNDEAAALHKNHVRCQRIQGRR